MSSALPDPSFCPPRALRSGLRFGPLHKRPSQRLEALAPALSHYDNLNATADDAERRSPPRLAPSRNSFRFPHELLREEAAHYERIGPARPSPDGARFGSCREEDEEEQRSPWFGSDWSAVVLRDSQASQASSQRHSVDAKSLLEYDSETLRKAADKNREVSKKLFRQLRSKPSAVSPQHGSQGSWDSNASEPDKTRLTKSPSQGSSSTGSSVYGGESTSSSGSESYGAPVLPPTPTRSVQPPPPILHHRTPSSGSRGVSRKISARKKAARENGGSVPDLSAPPPGSSQIWSEMGATRGSQETLNSPASPMEMVAERPPLPQKPPPPFFVTRPHNFPEDHPAASILQKYGSTPCLAEAGMSVRPVPPRRPSKEPLPASAEAKTPSLLTHGKPTVQVHPLCPDEGQPHSGPEDDAAAPHLILKIGPGEQQRSNEINSCGERRPPVPRKPDFLSPKKADAVRPRKAPAPLPPTTPPASAKLRSPGPKTPRAAQLSFVEDTVTRLSAFLSRNDERLRPILCPQSPSEDSDRSRASSVSEPNSALSSESKAKFLAGIYSSTSDLPSVGRSAEPAAPQGDADILEKTTQLIESLSQKLEILGEEESYLGEEAAANDRLSESVLLAFKDASAGPPATKADSVWADTGRLTKLESNLSGQLGRVIKALARVTDEAERRLLDERSARLSAQLADAQTLGRGLAARRATAVAAVRDALGPAAADDWTFALDTQRRLLQERRELDEKLQLGREQIAALSASLPH